MRGTITPYSWGMFFFFLWGGHAKLGAVRLEERGARGAFPFSGCREGSCILKVRYVSSGLSGECLVLLKSGAYNITIHPTKCYQGKKVGNRGERESKVPK